MTRSLTVASVILLALMTSACSNMVAVEQALPAGGSGVSGVVAQSAAGSDDIRHTIYQQYQQWKGTGYAYGGLDRQGLDCSGLVYLTYRDQLGIPLPRTTLKQSQSGWPVARNQLQAGDLVFFKTGVKARHVGIYIENNKFLHVSTSRGVMISRLDDYYWKDRFWQARRVGH
ncbi:MAG: NlpC/P60 family protein [Pseudomonadota bacterium]|nr:NlpC/P60 family protein [Pseudomonadota bacterium]